MKDASDILFDYLEAKRHLWNTHFRHRVDSLHDCSALDEFEKIDTLLFSALVVKEIKAPELENNIKFGVDPIGFLEVIPRYDMDSLPAMIGEVTSKVGSVKWGSRRSLNFEETKIRLNFISFFEWDEYGFTFYPYCRSRISQSGNPSLVGKDILLESNYIKIVTGD